MALPPGFLDELRSRISLAQVVGRKVTWDQRKSNPARSDHWAPCPFHQEKSASFHVDDAKGFYYCFGCGAKGDAVNFIRDTENVGFIEAVEILASEAGMPMPEKDPAAAARAETAKGLVEALEAAVQYYRLQLSAALGAEARAYLDRRGLLDETRDQFEIGFAPDGRTALLEHLRGKGFAVDKLVEAGLVGAPDNGKPYDRFRGRIVFPIRDGRGRAIGFGARALREGQQPKYLNSPDTPLFDKGRTLYNVGPARKAVGRDTPLVAVEGYMDVIALAQAGIASAVAPLGTAVTETQLAMMWRISDEPVIALDGDAAGMKAAQRVIDLALPSLTAGKSLRFAVMPSGQDPDDVIRDGGAQAIRALVEASQPIVDLLWTRETEGVSLDSPERRAALDARLRAHIERIADTSLRAHYQSEFRDRRRALFSRAKPVDRKRREGAVRQGGAVPATRASLLARSENGQAEARVRESAILAGCLNHPQLAQDFEDKLERMAFACSDLAQVRDAVLAELPDDAIDHVAFVARVTARMGRDPMAQVEAPGHVRLNRHLGLAADLESAKSAIEEELARHAAATGWRAEVRDAETEIEGEADEGLTWRLKHAADAAHQAVTAPLARSDATDSVESELSNHLQKLIDKEIWKKSKSH